MSMRNEGEGENRSRPGRLGGNLEGHSGASIGDALTSSSSGPGEKRGLVLGGVRLAGLGQGRSRVGSRKSMMDDSMSRSSVRRSFLHVTGSQRSENAAAPKKVDI